MEILTADIVLADGASAWGLTLPQTLVVVGLVLMAIDLFLQSDIATHIAYVLMSIAVVVIVPVHPLFRLLIGLGTWCLLVYVHYALWREFISRFANRIIAPTRYRTGAQGLVGGIGKVREINGVRMVEAHGDLWPFECRDELPTEGRVRIVSQRGGVLEVEVLKEQG